MLGPLAGPFSPARLRRGFEPDHRPARPSRPPGRRPGGGGGLGAAPPPGGRAAAAEGAAGQGVVAGGGVVPDAPASTSSFAGRTLRARGPSSTLNPGSGWSLGSSSSSMKASSSPTSSRTRSSTREAIEDPPRRSRAERMVGAPRPLVAAARGVGAWRRTAVGLEEELEVVVVLEEDRRGGGLRALGVGRRGPGLNACLIFTSQGPKR